MREFPVRKNLDINGESVIELDFNAHHLRILYARVGAEMPVDPYTVPGFDRATGKVAMLITINAKTERSATQATSDRCEISWRESKELIGKLKELNRPIAGFFHSDAGRMLQRIDSDIMDDAVYSLVSERIACIPVHDSIIVANHHQKELRDAMAAAWERRFPDTSTRIDEK